ncbi:hypothetical protein LEP1GSC047_3967 [Leptospira inadai serovar Lyme str. 10]|uniref:Acetyltransferase (GNAT) domain protein n=2 Tax=Leptospira inadai serovar Lyme TaxID=293084 RepID=V6HKU0_9LEPT|nr:hypothetical protein [Leptospira inadai]EQA37515.1 hypothetical protein LEP1GSC047_3967 [Leptospira inadai serovar Lyme str. 10]PNV75132.1 hypothetical protein BES34_009540 [Leptospira inadai serovar Lyme]
MNYSTRILITDSEFYSDAIRRIRKEVLRNIGLSPAGIDVEPISYATYLFGFREGVSRPVSMLETYFYAQRFASFEDSAYSQAGDLGSLGTLENTVHLRTCFVDPEYRKRSSLFLLNCLAAAWVNFQLGARGATTGTSESNDYVISLFLKTGWRRIGTYFMEGRPHVLFFTDLKRFFNHSRIQDAIHLLFLSDNYAGESRSLLSRSLLKYKNSSVPLNVK